VGLTSLRLVARIKCSGLLLAVANP